MPPAQNSPDSSSRPLGRQLLALFGTPCLWQAGQPTVLRFKYRRTVAVLGYMVAHPGRAVRRETLAELLWPQLTIAKARANLRLVLIDWVQVWRMVSDTPLLEVSRDTVLYRPSERWVSDLEWLNQPAMDEAVADWGADAVHALRTRSDWLSTVDDGLSDDFIDWLHGQRHTLGELQQRVTLGGDYLYKNSALSLDGKEVSATYFDNSDSKPDPQVASQELAVLALFKVERALETVELHGGGGDDDWSHAIARLTQQLALMGGHLLSGDDSACTFVFGLTSEHTGCRWHALRAAVETWSAVGTHARLRMAVTAGRMLIRHQPKLEVLGWRLRLLDRLTLYAEHGELVCCDSFGELVGHSGARVTHGVAFRGFDRVFDLHVQPLAVFARSQLPFGGGAFAGCFVGRQDALDAAAHGLALARAGQTASLTVQAPPGMGKTRLAWEVAARATGVNRVVWLVGRPETRSIPWRGLVDGLAALFTGQDSPQAQLTEWLQANGAVLSPEGMAAVLSLLQSRSVAHAARAALIQALATLLHPPAQVGATVCVIDDLQWLDEASTDTMNRVAALTTGVFWLVTLRNDAPLPLAFQHKPDATHQHIGLTPLGDAEALDFVRSLPDGARLDDVALQGRLAHAHGVPLYLLADAGAGADGNPHFGEFCNALLNRLRGHRPVLQTAATLGMRFAIADLCELFDAVGMYRTVEPALEQALAAGLLVAHDPQHLAFFHPRLREYLLSTLTGVALRHTSTRCAGVLEARGEHVGAAELWLQANDTPAAQRCWLAAATQAARNDDLFAALHAFDQLAALGYLTGACGVEARAIHARCLLARNGYGSPEAHQITQTLSAMLPDPAAHPDLVFDVLSLSYLNASGESHEAALAVGQHMVQAAHNPTAHHTAYWAMANALFWMGDFNEARTWFTQMAASGQALSRQQRMRYFPSDPMVLGQSQLAWMEWLCGHTEWSRQAQDLAAHHAGQGATQQDHVIHHVFAALLNWLQARFDEAHTQAGQALETAEAEGLAFWQALAMVVQGLVAAELGQAIDFAALAKQADHVQTHYPSAMVVALWLGGAALVASGQHALACSILNGTLDMAGPVGHGTCRADLLRLKSVAHQALGEADAARAAHQQALQWATQAGLKGWLARWGW